MKKVYLLVILTILSICVFAQKWETIKLPNNGYISNAIIYNRNFYIRQGSGIYSCNMTDYEWNLITDDEIVSLSGGDFINKNDSIIYYIPNTYFLYIKDGFSTPINSTFSFNSTYKPKIHVTNDNTVILDCSVNYTDIVLVESKDLYGVWDTIIRIPHNYYASIEYINQIVESKKGEIVLSVSGIGSYTWLMYKSDGDTKKWYLLNLPNDNITYSWFNEDSYMWFDAEDNLCINSDNKAYKYVDSVFMECPEYNSTYAAITDTCGNIFVSEINGKIKWSADNGKHWTYYDDILNSSVKKFLISNDGYLYALTNSNLYRLSEPIYKSPNITAINNNIHTNNILNGTFRIYSVMGTYCGTANIQNGDLTELKERLKKGVFIIQSADKQLTKKIIIN